MHSMHDAAGLGGAYDTAKGGGTSGLGRPDLLAASSWAACPGHGKQAARHISMLEAIN